MKKLILSLWLLAPFAGAQETWPSATATAAQVTASETARLIYNAETCKDALLPVGCTQAQLDAIPGNTRNLATDTAATRAAISRVMVVRYTPAPGSPYVQLIKRQLKWAAWTQAKRDDYCVSVLELSAGCDPFGN